MTGRSRASYTDGFTLLKMPPTRIGFHASSAPARWQTSSIRVKAR